MKHLLLSIALLSGTAAQAQINSPEAAGYLARGRIMFDQANYAGCIDQLSALDRSALTAADREAADWLLANAAYHTSGAAARPHFRAFLANYPASPLREAARLRMAACLLQASPAQALKELRELDLSAFSPALHDEAVYQTAYARLMTGDSEAALPAFLSLADSRQWGNDACYYAGYIYYTRHDYTQAGQYLTRVAPKGLTGALAQFYRAQIAYTRADYDCTLQIARAAADNGALPVEYRTEALRLQGESLFHQGKKRQGMELLEKYIAAAENPALSALYLVGLDQYSRGRTARAVELLQPVTASDDAMGQTAYLYIGEALMDSGDTSAAILAFDNARRMNHDPEVREAAMYDYAVARSRGASVPFASSVEVFEEYLRAFPEGAHSPQVQEFIVKGYLTDRNYSAALASIERMAHPTADVLAAKQQILYALGSQALATGDLNAAESYLTRSRQLARYSAAVDAQAALALGETRYRQGKPEQTVALINEYLRTAPASDANQAVARYDLGYARLALKDYADAAVNFAKVADAPGQLSDATVADALARLADTYYYRSDWSRAAQYYDRAYDRNPAAGDYPLLQKAVMQGYQRDHKGKIESLNAMLRQFPTSSLRPEALMELTESYQQLGQTDRAIATYRTVVADYPDTAQGRRAMLQLALTLLNAGKHDDAVATYREVIASYPTSEEAAMAADELKRISAADGTLPEFAAFLASIDRAPQLDVAETDRLEFEAAEKIWLTSANSDRLRQYLDRYPDGAFRPQALGYLIEVSAGNPAQVVEYASEILEKYPHSPVAETALEARARANASLGLGEESLADWQELARRASTPQGVNAARAGVMRTAREMGRADLMLQAADELLASSTLGAEMRTEATFTRGLANSLNGDPEAARADWSAIASDTDDIYGTKAAFYLAESYTRGDKPDFAAARRTLQALIDSATPHTYWLARAFILLSDVNAAEGNTFEAREYLRSLRENYPGNEPDIIQMIDSRLSKLK